MGDVAMLLPQLYAAARLNPDDCFTLLTQPFLTGLLVHTPANLTTIPFDKRGPEGKFGGLISFVRQLHRKHHFDAVLDMHGVLRSQVIRSYLKLHGIPFTALRKPRRLRSRLIHRQAGSMSVTLPKMTDLYRDLLLHRGLAMPPAEEFTTLSLPEDLWLSVCTKLKEPKNNDGHIAIGIAPFASTSAKTYDLDLMEQVIASLAEERRYRIYLFGGKGKEAETLQVWAGRYNDVRCVAGTLKLSEELALISRLRCMISMDSANMHMASMVGVRVISIWCGTHPAAGFLGYGQQLADCLLPTDLDCCPCTIFGNNKTCRRGDFACRHTLTPDRILRHIRKATPTL